MWKDLRNKMKKLLDTEEKKDQETLHNIEERNDVNAKTKMTYRYPKQGEFRFPVIPDAPGKAQNENESYQRPRRKKPVEKQEPVEGMSQRKKRPRKEEKTHEELPETSSIPFTPTDVPSPIYGYQARQLTKGLERLEYAVEEQQSQPEFFTDSNDEKQWQELRKRMRARVDEENSRPKPASELPKILDREEAATSETTLFEETVEERRSEYTEDIRPNISKDYRGLTFADDELGQAENEQLDEHSPLENESPGETDKQDKTLETTRDEKHQEVGVVKDGPKNLSESLQEAIKRGEEDSLETAEASEDKEEEYTRSEASDGEQETNEMQTSSETENEEKHRELPKFNQDKESTLSMLDEKEESLLTMDGMEDGELDDSELEVTETQENDEQTDIESEQVNHDEVLARHQEEPFPSNREDEMIAKGKTEQSESEMAKEQPVEDGVDDSTSTEPSEEETEMYQQAEVEKTNREEQPQSQNETENKTSSNSHEPSKKKDGQKRRVPFNVLMTPRDKRNRDHEKKTNNQHEKTEPKKDEPAARDVEEEKSKRVEYHTPLHLLEDPVRPTSLDDSWITEQMELLETTLRHFHVRAKVVNAMKGPTVTRFEVQPEPGVKVSKITNLSDDIKLSMAARDIRIEAPIPGKQAVGIEIPNKQSMMVGLQEIFESEAFQNDNSPLTVGLGLDIGGDSIVTNLKKMPHGLIAGATGSGKSVCINTILISLLYKAHHEDVKFLLIDPKMVELAPYNDLPHLVSPVITDVKAATTALKWAVKEMEERYEKFVEEGVRDVERYNEKMKKQQRDSEKLPYLVIVIDELADLMMVSPQDVEDAICRIAQKARACGIHLLLATQRPSVDVITGLIKANIPTRIAFSVSSQVDSRTIIDSGGAEKLLGRGDMLFVENGSGQPVRIQGAFVSDDEIERVTHYVKKIAPPQYLFHQEELMKQISTEEETDELFDEAVEFVVQQNGASASLIQRRFKVGYNRAARLIDQMEAYGIISEQKGSKPRDILLTRQQIEEMME
ncbi:DNA translocase FtsK [Halobacillus aidingensis]|uniref:DNA segregation ATPase FtsK/SpoIIIE, S-DNA-T family n=3 Tax=Halobacillus TaxID=45667 RepID=A0A1H0DXL3_HALAD|nr:DNA translocase FtsK [Halobacillus aidingensis]SDN74751.1 DNA segregation ATPase FtsK/SpoIIIE, S-DNA-T family [Halobacillus aidingensis]